MNPQSEEKVSCETDSPKDIDEIFDNMGPRARYQIILQLMTILVSLAISFNFVLPYFTGDDPGWRCRTGNSSHFCQQNYNMTFSSSDKDFYVRCKLKRHEWEFLTPSTYSFVTEFDLVCKKRSIAALASSSYYIGGLIGSIMSGYVSDTFGRKPVLLVATLTYPCMSIGSSFVRDIWQLIFLNILLGAASVAIFFTIYVYQLEFMHPRQRATAISLQQWALVASFLLMDTVAYYEREWRKLKMYTAFPCFISLIVIALAPESPRWLMSVGKVSEAKKMMAKICRINGESFSIAYSMKSREIADERTYSYLDIFKKPKILLFTCRVAILWFMLALVHYALLLGSSNRGGDRYEAFAITAVADIIPFLVSPYLANRFGRKKITIGGLLAASVLTGCLALVPQSIHAAYHINMVIAFIAETCNVFAFVVMYTWSFELFPTTIRSQGIFICIFMERVGLILVPFFTNVLRSVARILPFIIMCALGVFLSLINITLPETNNKPTREYIGDIFEKPVPIQSNDGVDNLAQEEEKQV